MSIRDEVIVRLQREVDEKDARIKELEVVIEKANDLIKVMDIPKNKPTEDNYQYRLYTGRLYDFNKSQQALFIESKGGKK